MMHLKYRQLEVFKALMESGSISQAAYKLNCTQPTVSVALSNFEAELGFSLFHRTKGFFSPTRQAEFLFEEVERSLISLDRVKSRAREIKEGGAGMLRIATFGAPSMTLIPNTTARLLKKINDISISINVRSSMQVALATEGRQCDVGLVESTVKGQNLMLHPFSLPCVCLMNKKHELAQKKHIDLIDLDKLPLIGITGTHKLDLELNHLAQNAGINLHRRANAYFFAIARQLVSKNIGVAIIDIMNGVVDLDADLTWRPFTPELSYEMTAIQPKLKTIPIHTEIFIECMELELEQIRATYESGPFNEPETFVEHI